MKTKITDTSNTINKGGRAERWWQGRAVKARSSKPVRSMDNVDLHKILQTYNLKGFEFGNWLTNNDRYDRVLACEDSLAELSRIIGTKNIGMNCLVGIAFGARGTKGALAHYEPAYNMINITKEKGDGCLAHEFGHALDYNIGKYSDQHKYYNYLSGGRSLSVNLKDNTGGKVRNLMNEVVNIAAEMIKDYPASNYWKRRTEIFARLFEQYCCYILKVNGVRDAFLTSPWSSYVNSPVYWNESNFKKLLPKMERLIKAMKSVMK